MLLTDTISKTTSAIKMRRATIESKQLAEAYGRALVQLSQATDGIKATLACAVAMKDNGIVDTPLMDETTRSDLLAIIDDCGNGVSEITLSLETVRLLKSKGDGITSQIKLIWKDAAKKYSDGTKGYLTMIGGLSADPKRSKELADNIGKLVAGDPTIAGINSLVSNVAEAKEIVEAFSLNPEIELFLKKVSAQQATVVDLTPNVLAWLKEKNLTSKLRVRF